MFSIVFLHRVLNRGTLPPTSPLRREEAVTFEEARSDAV